MAIVERRKSSEDERGRESNSALSASDDSTSEESHKLKPFMVDVTVYFHEVAQEEVKKLTRYLIAYPYPIMTNTNPCSFYMLILILKPY